MALSVATGVLTVSTLTSAATHASPSLGFAPKAVLLWISGRSETSDTTGSMSHDLGFGIAVDAGGGTVTRRCVASQSLHSNTNSGADVANRDDAVLALLNHATAGGTLQGLVDITLDSDTFTLVNDSALDRALRVSYLAWGGTDLTNYEIGTITEAAATGTQQTTLAGSFQPDAVLLLSAGLATINTVGTDSYLSAGVATSSASADQWVIAGGADDALGTSNTEAYFREGEVLALHAATPPTTPGASSLDCRASLSAVGSTSFTLNYAERGASRLIFYLAMKGGQWKAGRQSIVANLGSGQTNSVTGLAFQPKSLFVGYSGYAPPSASDTPVAYQEMGFGAATGSGAQHCQWVRDDDASATTVVGAGIATSAVIKYIDSGAGTNLDLAFTSFNSGGYTLTNSVALNMDGTDGAFVGYLVAGDAAGGGTDDTITLTGAALTLSAGTLAQDWSAEGWTLTGDALTTNAGTLSESTGSNDTITLTGDGVTLGDGTLADAVHQSHSLTGDALTVASTDFAYSESDTVTLTGDAVTLSSGTLTESTTGNDTITLTGASVTLGSGTLADAVSQAHSLTGDVVTIGSGSVSEGANQTHALTGDVVTLGAGTLVSTVDQSHSLTGGSVTLGGGTLALANDDAVALSGDVLTLAAGSLTAVGPDAFSGTIGATLTLGPRLGATFLHGPRVGAFLTINPGSAMTEPTIGLSQPNIFNAAAIYERRTGDALAEGQLVSVTASAYPKFGPRTALTNASSVAGTVVDASEAYVTFPTSVAWVEGERYDLEFVFTMNAGDPVRLWLRNVVAGRVEGTRG